MFKRIHQAALALAAATIVSTPLFAQVVTEPPPRIEGAKPVGVERVKIPGPSLQGNLEGNAVEREAIVYLPPSYHKERSRRYPVVYGLHGYYVGPQQWSQEIHAPQSIEGAFALGAKEVIVVLPDGKTLHNGSMYSSSATTGDFERYVARDVVAYIDANYRTLPRRESRGLVGHSMGGYGAARIGMKYPDVFGSLYLMSPCCLSVRTAPPPGVEEEFKKLRGREDLEQQSFMVRATLAAAAAWSPNPDKPPFYVDLPFGDDATRQDVLGRWAANAPLAFVDQYIGNLRQYRGIAMDVGDRDMLRIDTAKLHGKLRQYGIDASFEEYAGDHTNKLGERIQNHVLKFFSDTLCFDEQCGR
jgi:enterochelin esterase-like enzyme